MIRKALQVVAIKADEVTVQMGLLKIATKAKDLRK